MSANMMLPGIEIEPEPTQEELEKLRMDTVNMRRFGIVIDPFYIADCPDNLHYEWGPVDNAYSNHMALQGFKRNDALAARSTYLNPDKDNGNMIQDVACYTIHKKKKQAMNEAFEITKKMKADPKLAYTDIVKEYGNDFVHLPEKEIAENKREILSGVEAQAAVQTDWVKSGQKLNKE